MVLKLDKEIKAVYFDLDDTLFDYEYAHQKALLTLFKRIQKYTKMPLELISLAFSIAQKDVKMQLAWTAASHNRDLYLQKFFEKINHKQKNTIHPNMIVQLYDYYWNKFYSSIKKDIRSKKTLKYLQNKWIKIWIITDSISYVQFKKLERLWLSEYIDVFVSSEEAWFEKPHPGCFLLWCYKAWVLVEESMMVGDNIERDILWSQWIWMNAIRLNRYHRKDKGIRPTYTVNSSKELYKLIKKII